VEGIVRGRSSQRWGGGDADPPFAAARRWKAPDVLLFTVPEGGGTRRRSGDLGGFRRSSWRRRGSDWSSSPEQRYDGVADVRIAAYNCTEKAAEL